MSVNGITNSLPVNGVATMDPAPVPPPNLTVADWMGADTDAERETIERDFIGRIELTILTYREVLRDLGPYIVGEQDLPEVAKALQFIVKLLKTVDVPIPRMDAHILVEYFSKRLETSGDTLNHRAGIKESAEALFALADMTEHKIFLPDDAGTIAKAVLSIDPNGVFRNQKASTRLAIYNLLDLLIEKHSWFLFKHIGANEFVGGLITLSEFEKEPTCLRIVFDMSSYISRSRDWNILPDIYSRLWESFSRYFPITLKASRGQDLSIPTPAELKQSLLNCFVAHDNYAKEAFPQLMTRLDVDQDISANTKLDVFDTMASCIKGYSLEIILEWINKIWDSLKFEIWNGENEEFIQGALKVINAIASAISFGDWKWDDHNHASDRFLRPVLKECTDRIIDSKQRYMSSTGRILYALASGSTYTFCQVANKTLPALLLLWGDLSYNSEKASLIEVFNGILRARTEVGEASLKDFAENTPKNPAEEDYWHRSQSALISDLKLYKGTLVDSVYWAAMTDKVSDTPDDTVFRVNTIKGLVLLTKIPGFLEDFEQGTIIDTLNKMALDSSQTADMHTEAISALQQVSVNDPTRFSAITLPNLLASLVPGGPTNESEDIKEAEKKFVYKLIDDLVEISCREPCIVEDPINNKLPFPTHTVFDAFQKKMTAKFLEALKSDNKSMDYARLILTAMSLGLKMFDAALDEKLATSGALTVATTSRHPYAEIILRLFRSLAQVKEDATGGFHIGVDASLKRKDMELLVNEVGNMATTALRSQQTTSSNNFLGPNVTFTKDIWSLFTGRTVAISQLDLRNATPDKYLAIILSASLISGIKKEEKDRLQFGLGNIGQAMINNVNYPGDDNTPFARVTCLKILQLLINKFGAASEKADGETLTLFDQVKKLIDDQTGSTDQNASANAYQTLIYFTAAALACCDKTDRELISMMIEGIKHPLIGRKVASSFRLLLADSDTLTKESFCIVRPLRHGRLYAHAVDNLISVWRNETDPAIKTNALIALAGTLEHMESAVYLDQASTILPLILEGTNIQDEDGRDGTKLACIKIIEYFVLHESSAVISHLDSVINRMTDRTRNTYFSPSDSRISTRAAALSLLSLLTKKIDKQQLLKRKAHVLSELSSVLDDSSILVRIKAVDCKLFWSYIEEA